jgi:SpoVK/Ycf46/Vps4 family AAA+-type ATPase
LHTVKERIHELQKFNAINQLKKKKGIATPNVTMHLVFTGNPGTGKTTVARILGEVYHSIGLLDSGQTIMVNALDLLAKYVGQTAPKVEETFNHALGGVLFIDEA